VDIKGQINQNRFKNTTWSLILFNSYECYSKKIKIILFWQQNGLKKIYSKLNFKLINYQVNLLDKARFITMMVTIILLKQETMWYIGIG